MGESRSVVYVDLLRELRAVSLILAQQCGYHEAAICNEVLKNSVKPQLSSIYTESWTMELKRTEKLLEQMLGLFESLSSSTEASDLREQVNQLRVHTRVTEMARVYEMNLTGLLLNMMGTVFTATWPSSSR